MPNRVNIEMDGGVVVPGLGHIAYRTTTHLFWGKYPFRVMVRFNRSRWYSRPAGLTREAGWADYQQHHDREMRRRGAFVARCFEDCPQDRMVWTHRPTQRAANFFFLRRADCDAFVAAEPRRVMQVHGPASDAEVAVMAAEVGTGPMKALVRPTLFFDRYRYCVIFKRERLDFGFSMVNGRAVPATRQPAHEVDGWFTEVLGDDPERAILRRTGARRLYLAHEADVVMVKIAFPTEIERFERVILRSEISDEADSGAEAD